MRYLSLTLFLFLSLFLTSCLEITEIITINKDGSGRYETYVDMSELLSNPMMAMMMQQEGGTDMTDKNVDSTIYMGEEIIALNPELKAEEREMLKKFVTTMKIDFAAGIGEVRTGYDFTDPEGIDRMNDLLSRVKTPSDEEDGEGGPGGGAGMLGSIGGMTDQASNIIWKKGKFTRTFTGDRQSMMDKLGDQVNMEMMKGMFEEMKMSTEYRLPGKVKKHTFPNGTVSEDGRTIRIPIDMDKVLNDPASIDLSGTVKYKKK
ncbi:MAG: hypothetical protein WBA17_08295 [Saprospiraceae bacterium]